MLAGSGAQAVGVESGRLVERRCLHCRARVEEFGSPPSYRSRMDWGSTRPLDGLDDPAAARLFAGARASVGASHANSYPPVRARICSATGTVSSIAPESCPPWAGIRKNREERLVVLNRLAKSVVDEMRDVHDEFVFAYKGGRVQKMNSSAWRRARQKAGMPQVRVHDLKHTFGRRLRAAGVSFEDRQDLLGHRSGRITTHYSAAELGNLIEAANRVCAEGSRKSPALVMLKRQAASA